MPGRHIHDHQMRLFMKLRLSKSLSVAAAQAGFSIATAYRVEQDQRKPSINRALFIDADEVQGLGYEVGSAIFQGRSAS